MGLLLVGETIDAATAHKLGREGQIIPITRGVYLESADEIEGAVRAHGVRIAHYLYPQAYLCSASAIDLAPSADGRLFLAGRRNQRTRLRGLEIVQTQAPPKPSLDKAIVGDALGEFTISVSSPEQRMLEAFRLRSEQASALSPDMRRATANRLIAEYGSPEAAADRLWILARTNDWFREGESAELYLRRNAKPAERAINHAAFNLDVAWHGTIIGTLGHDGHEWRWSPAKAASPTLVREPIPGVLPPFIESLLPEGWLKQILKDEDQRTALRNGKRYMSNITIAPRKADLKKLPADMLEGRLAKFTSSTGEFHGRYEGPGGDGIHDSFEANLARVFSSGETPRLSGIQIKAPMYLDKKGVLRPADDLPFTHILKPAGTSGFEGMAVVEWLSLELARRSGFQTAQTALVEMPGDLPPALLVERFDIRTGPHDQQRLALEDFCSILGVGAEDKYKGTIERMARALKSISTDPKRDLLTLFARALFAWLIADGDMHLKNVAVLKIAKPDAKDFEKITMAPVYDALTTRVFPGLEHDHMALKLSGKDERIGIKDFERLAKTIDLPLETARQLMTGMRVSLESAPSNIEIPGLLQERPDAMGVIERVFAIVAERVGGFFVQ